MKCISMSGMRHPELWHTSVFELRHVTCMALPGRVLMKAHAAPSEGTSDNVLSPRKRRLAEQHRRWKEQQEHATKTRPCKVNTQAPVLHSDVSVTTDASPAGDSHQLAQTQAISIAFDAEVEATQRATLASSASTTPEGEEEGLPFCIFSGLLSWINLQELLEEVDLRQDTIYLDGNSRAVSESRLTGWQSDIGATFKYSGKEMIPSRSSLTPQVAKVRDALVNATGVRFDSVLINLYRDGRCGMRYHADPLYGCWTPNTAVVSIGQTRKFVFRETENFSARWEFLVENGDVVFMFGDCQDRMQHCIKVEREDRGAAEMGARMSLVFKQRIRDVTTGQYK